MGGNKTIKVNGTLVIQTGGSSRLGFTDKTSSFETEVLTVLATKEIIFESPLMTFAGNVNISGALNVGGPMASGTAAIAPNLGKELYSGTRGSASAPAKPALRTPGI